MTALGGRCCGNCEAFMPDPIHSRGDGACALPDPFCAKHGTYNATSVDYDCEYWAPSKGYVEFKRRLKGDWT